MAHPADQRLAISYLIRQRWLARLLHNGDIQLMAHSVEGRVPFADPTVLALADAISPETALANGIEKHHLRSVAAAVLPPEIAWRPKSALTKTSVAERSSIACFGKPGPSTAIGSPPMSTPILSPPSPARRRSADRLAVPAPRHDDVVRPLGKRMKVAFVLIPEKGHVNPYIGPAQALQERGHSVVIAAPGDIAAQITAAGLPFHALPGSSDRPTHGAALVELIQDRERLSAWVGQLLLDGLISRSSNSGAGIAKQQ